MNKITCLKNTTIEKLGGEDCEWEIISEFIPSKVNVNNSNKELFIMQKFKDIIKDDDDFEYGNNNGKKRGSRKSFSWNEEIIWN